MVHAVMVGTVPPMRPGKGRRCQQGFTYLLVLFLVAGLGLVGAQVGVVWQQVMQREREAELLATGVEFARALARYAAETPVGTPARPTELKQLVEDGRWPTPRRHLRRIYRDPMTGRAEWGVVRDGGGIVGVHSLSPRKPIRSARLPPELDGDSGQASAYSEWIFRPTAQ